MAGRKPALFHRSGCKAGKSNNVSDRVDVWFRRLVKRIHLDAAAVIGDDVGATKVKCRSAPRAADRVESLIGDDLFDCVLGSRILGSGALRGGMPLYKYIANRFLTASQNLLVNYKLSEYHTGYRAFSRAVLERINFNANDDDFVFDNEMLSQIIYHGFDIGEVTCPTKYFEEASSINFSRSMKYGFGCLRVSSVHLLNKIGLLKTNIYQ